jgi:hypothetical protein
MTSSKLVAAAAAGLLAAAAFAAEPVRWINVHVVEHEDNTDVKVHLPLSLVQTLVDAVHTKDFDAGMVTIDMDRAEIDWVVILRELQKAPEGEYVTVEEPDASVHFGKQDGVVTVDVQEKGEHGEHVVVRLQEPLLNAVKVEGDRLDVRALLSRLTEAKVGDLLTVESTDANVRVWVE